MLVVSLRGVNFGFWSHLVALGKTQSYVAVVNFVVVLNAQTFIFSLIDIDPDESYHNENSIIPMTSDIEKEKNRCDK